MIRRDARRRLVLLALLAPFLAITTWLKIEDTPPEGDEELRIVPIAAERPPGWPDGLTITGSWHLMSDYPLFGGYSALVALPDDRLIAYSDVGNLLRFGDPSAAAAAPFAFAKVPRDPESSRGSDIEAATRDPETGTIWLSYEGRNAIRRFRLGADHPQTAEPPAMRDWPENGGPEAMTRLPDGRFIVLAERDATISRQPGEGLLFPGDPLDGGDPVRFRLHGGGGFQPVDMAALPDGRVLVLLRTLDWGWPPFRGRLMLADPADIVPGEAWPWQLLAELDSPLPRENYEGLAIVPAPEGGLTIWIIADDNRSQFQRSLLLKLHWAEVIEGAFEGRGS